MAENSWSCAEKAAPGRRDPATPHTCARILGGVNSLRLWNLLLGVAVAVLALVVGASGAFRAALRRLRGEQAPLEALIDAATREAASADRSAQAAAEHAETVRLQLEVLQQGLATGARLDAGERAPAAAPSPPPVDTSTDIEFLNGGGGENPDTGVHEVEVILLFLSERPIFDLEFALLGPRWKRDSQPVELEAGVQAGTWSVMRSLAPLEQPDHSWDEFVDRLGRRFRSPEPPPTDSEAWAVLSYGRAEGGPTSIWQRFPADASNPNMLLEEPVGRQHSVDGAPPDDDS